MLHLQEIIRDYYQLTNLNERYFQIGRYITVKKIALDSDIDETEQEEMAEGIDVELQRLENIMTLGAPEREYDILVSDIVAPINTPITPPRCAHCNERDWSVNYRQPQTSFGTAERCMIMTFTDHNENDTDPNGNIEYSCIHCDQEIDSHSVTEIPAESYERYRQILTNLFQREDISYEPRGGTQTTRPMRRSFIYETTPTQTLTTQTVLSDIVGTPPSTQEIPLVEDEEDII